MFDFPVDEPEPHPAYGFFAPGPLPRYAGNPNNNNGWNEADVPLLGELGVVIAPVVDMDEDIAMLFGDDEFEDDDSGGFNEEECSTGLPVPPLVIEDMSTRLGNLEYGHGQLVKKVIQVSDAEVAAGVTIGEIGPRVFAIEGQVQVMASQMVHVADRFEQIGTQIQQLQTTVSEMSSRESTLMQCILGMDRRLADLERRAPGPQ
ncbi:hypothetical protein Tco_1347833 [Tanacetum coccineum]